MPLYVLSCTDGHRQEHLLPADAPREAACACGKPAAQVYGYSVGLLPPSVDTRGMFRRFSEASQELEARGAANVDFWGRAKARARGMIEAGEHPVGRNR